MSELPQLKDIFDKLRQGSYITHEQGTLHAALADNYEAYKEYFEPLGLNLIRHPRDFFYLHTEAAEGTPPSMSLPPIAVFSFILIEATANEGRPVEEYLLTERFSVAGLPHLTTDRYKAHLKAVGIDDEASLRKLVKSMVRLGWVEYFPDDTFRFLRPFHRVFDKCQEISAAAEPGAQSVLVTDEKEIDPEMN
jgi:chromosome condensin MukBEF MukE localization factor